MLDLGGQILEVLLEGLDFLRLLLVQTVQGVGATAPVVHILLASRLGFEFGLLLRLLRFGRGLLVLNRLDNRLINNLGGTFGDVTFGLSVQLLLQCVGFVDLALNRFGEFTHLSLHRFRVGRGAWVEKSSSRQLRRQRFTVLDEVDQLCCKCRSALHGPPHVLVGGLTHHLLSVLSASLQVRHNGGEVRRPQLEEGGRGMQVNTVHTVAIYMLTRKQVKRFASD